MFRWSEETFNHAKKLYKQGVRTSVIAEKIGTTKNSVLGKMHRNNLTKKSSKNRRNTRHSQSPHYEKHGEAKCWLCNKTYTTYSRFDRFCSPCKSRDFYRATT